VLDGEWNRRLHRRELDGGCLVRGGGFELEGIEDGRVCLGIANNRQQACVVPIQHGFEVGRSNERLVHNADHCAAVSAVKVEEPGDDVDCGASMRLDSLALTAILLAFGAQAAPREIDVVFQELRWAAWWLASGTAAVPG
jgi:hypothetical protein